MNSNVRYWHLTDNPVAPAFVRYWTKADIGGILARDVLSANDPKRTSANGLKAVNFEQTRMPDRLSLNGSIRPPTKWFSQGAKQCARSYSPRLPSLHSAQR